MAIKNLAWLYNSTGNSGYAKLATVVICVSLAIANTLIYLTGGTPNTFAHLDYVPILVGSIVFGVRGGILVGAIASLLLAPFLIPSYTEPVLDWSVRVLFFLLAGVFNGLIARMFHRQIEELQKTAGELRETLNQTTAAFVRAVDSKHPYTADHSTKVAHYAVMIARELNLQEDEVLKINQAALLHDVGKIGVPNAILNKPGRLTDEEWDVIKHHPVASYQIVREMGAFEELLPAIRGHHEAWDGTGYPDRLKGDEMHLWTRILAMADAWDAMTSDRAYRNALSTDEALRRVRQGKGTQFDPDVVEAFISAMELSLTSESLVKGEAAASGDDL